MQQVQRESLEEVISLQSDHRFKLISQYFGRIVDQKLEFLVSVKLDNQKNIAESIRVQGEILGIREVLGLPDALIEERS